MELGGDQELMQKPGPRPCGAVSLSIINHWLSSKYTGELPPNAPCSRWVRRQLPVHAHRVFHSAPKRPTGSVRFVLYLLCWRKTKLTVETAADWLPQREVKHPPSPPSCFLPDALLYYYCDVYVLVDCGWTLPSFRCMPNSRK